MKSRKEAHKQFGKMLGLTPEKALAALERHLQELNAQQVAVLNLFYALKGVKTPVKNKDIAVRMGKKPERVSQIRERALERLRRCITKEKEEI